ncbi:calcium-transporting ATPase 4, endoplasmic reticulum-type-like [Olea europaea subsp. europaea]|uniref:Calcium-transporting ATPase 4, endoplasmic reticulum-type-like n=1 Tax=Olea europaea subsp. europaea TaxID=158383 RepID=A0A8S0S1K3_OLEEU|nr:calcium-transporting ATPase 4, endoplasmic reticulum-type-like [Olea europaea subsp. europaea]
MKKPPRRSDDSLISPWILFRYLAIASYVGIATVGIFVIWYTRTSFLPMMTWQMTRVFLSMNTAGGGGGDPRLRYCCSCFVLCWAIFCWMMFSVDHKYDSSYGIWYGLIFQF